MVLTEERSSPDLDTVVAGLIETIRPYCKSDASTLTAATELGSIGIDSFDFVEIIFKLEETYGIDIDYNANKTFSDIKTIGDLAAEVVKQASAKTAA